MNMQNQYTEPMSKFMNFQDKSTVTSRQVSREQSPVPQSSFKQSNNIGRYVKYGLVPLAAYGLVNGIRKYGPKLYHSITAFNKAPTLNPNITNYLM